MVFSLTVEFFGDFAVAEALSDEGEDLEFAGCDGKVFAFFLVSDEEIWLVLGRCVEAEPNSESGEGQGSQAAIDLEGVFDDQKAVLGPLQEGDEAAAE